MKILITGANGFLGRALVNRILADGGLGGGGSLQRLTLVVRSEASGIHHPLVRIVRGDLRDPETRAAAVEDGIDCVFHLAGVLIAQSEPDFELGRSVNLDATVAFCDELRKLECPRVVFTSTIGVYGGELPELVDDATPPAPTLSYGTHKLMVEYYLADLSRRGDIDARSVRVPGTLPRPRLPDRAFSPAFGSNLFHAVAAGETFDCPVSPEATLWALSLRCCIDNLLHAARLSNGILPRQRVWTLPALHVSMEELFEALVARIGPHARDLVQWRPDPSLELALGRFPALQTSIADSLGFRHDGDVEALVTNVITELQ